MAVLRMMLFKSFADFGLKDLAKSMTEFPCRACCENKMRAMPCKHFTAANGATSVDPLVRPAPFAQIERFIR